MASLELLNAVRRMRTAAVGIPMEEGYMTGANIKAWLGGHLQSKHASKALLKELARHEILCRKDGKRFKGALRKHALYCWHPDYHDLLAGEDEDAPTADTTGVRPMASSANVSWHSKQALDTRACSPSACSKGSTSMQQTSSRCLSPRSPHQNSLSFHSIQQRSVSRLQIGSPSAPAPLSRQTSCHDRPIPIPESPEAEDENSPKRSARTRNVMSLDQDLSKQASSSVSSGRVASAANHQRSKPRVSFDTATAHQLNNVMQGAADLYVRAATSQRPR
ncbi:uncharacterized protein MONBRDRAFT_6990 [Monosiga brevicollis MX1]|uniref:Uncharacterized protein n=1 Tax=Monosiga brevicollis TaxID=81824 RepID=A9UVK5_MONBE|nr:uncharacterized protein MONBRDRAFT_6990 [Monosiga brevicollis MX1]EDQ90413.1 predicted protein [Monosiga brevicollis MX1]|eukprot:XP_001744464.1 hypothetical protein [Monosiga brevicollis MX1]